ncbi:von Willebrand factor type A [Haloterrigena turkmenica DSM 5511]|uniref:von Willebrand factor type A n=1 Tax=Haloterrigena turkmenica (strain ATCC 51198 / DSM 5511 / JCM 9101 / NCIMB 13204 / VKM B-1734 / 4k) TaxID=543526 RepID=D2RSW3_HALTV|nr:vWA domain-containing protein [Haloterrigena turkmenica]ADB58937.1 von Willebrand factor type A [Haloterrigena turkmenica DSM 5511]
MRFNKERVVAVFFAVLMVTSAIAMPALASGPSATAANERSASVAAHPGNGPAPNAGPPGQNGGPPGHDRGDANVTIPDLEENTSVDAILNATYRLEELEIENETAAAVAVNDTVDAVNALVGEYRRVRYADSRAAFDRLADAQRSLAVLKDEVDGDDEAIVDAISEELYAAGNASARLAVSDANAVVAANEGEFRNPGQRQKAESALGNAVDGLERADRAVSDGVSGNGTGKSKAKKSDRPIGPTDRAKALTHLENAWKHAERTLDTVEANTEPSLSLSQGRPFERNGTVRVSIRAVLSDVRPYAYDNATVTVNGDADADAVSFATDEAAGTDAIGSTLVDLGSDPENVTITVTATAAHDADRTVEATHDIRIAEEAVVRERPDPDEYRNVEVVNESSGVSVAVGGDGLDDADVSITDETPTTDDPYRAGPMVRIENERPIDDATVEIPIDENALEADANLSIVTWDPTSDEPWTPVETEIDRDAGVATAEVDHFSFFSVFRIEEWEDETSDTITLDGNETDGEIGNGSGIETADFVFVNDESGSMSGSPTHYAELAGKRFVGALTDSERAGRVGYASGANLDQPLTTDHDAVNSSLERLSASGGTNTRAGLRVGLNHLEEEGWENRSAVMILLSDGKSGSDPLPVAEDAAEAGVEISTVGLGNNINENELREIAAITGGDFYHVEREEDLPDTFERVAENQTGPGLQDTNGDGIPDLVAEMDLSMPTGEPGVVGEPLNLDPTALDTSGDGILDNETVDIKYRVFQEDNETKLHAAVTYAEHHPARIDTTGDGLTDAEQLSDRTITYTDSRSDSLEFLSELEDADDIDDLDGLEGDVLTTDTVRSDPLVDDSDGDGVTDAEEVRLGTDPESRDTTGDGISDSEGLNGDYDPTLFDIEPPEITVTYATFNDPDADVELKDPVDVDWSNGKVNFNDPVDASVRVSGSYEVDFTVTDSAGLDEARVVRDGDVEETVSLSGQWDDADVEFDVGTVDTFTDAFAGSRVTVQADDRHGIVDGVGTTEAAAVEVGGVWAAASDELRAQGVSDPRLEQDLGTLQGMTTGAGESIDSLRALYNEPIETITAVREIPGAIANFDEIIAAMPDSIEAQQQRNNPHDPDESPRLYESFRQGWYEGYIAWFVIEAAIPAGEAGKALKSSDRVRKTVDKISTPRIRQAAQMAGRAGHTAKTPVRYGRLQFSRGLSTGIGLTQKAGENVLSRVSTVGQQYRVAKLLNRHDVDGAAINRLDADGQEAIGKATARNGDDASRVMADGGPDPVARAYQLDLDVNNENLVSNLFRHSEAVDFERVIDNLEELNRPNADIEGVDDLAKRLAAGDQSNVKGAAFEAEVAVVRGSDNVEAVGKPNPYSRGEIDIETSDGRVIETKSGDYSQAADGSDKYIELENQIGHYQQYTEVEGGTIEVAFREEPHDDIKDMLNDNDAEVEIYNE